MRVDLGGPGAACSARRVRRLAAGELAASEAERVARHVAECARCGAVQRELLEEKAELLRAVPFEAFAAGVAEKLALVPRRRPSVLRWAGPLAAAAAVALVAGVLRQPAREEPGVRSKGGASAELFVQEGSGAARPLRAGEPVAPGARLQLVLHPSGRRQAAAVLLEPGEATVLYSGPAVQGALPQAFEWTGAGSATLLLVLADAAVDAGRLHGRADAPPGSDVIELALRR